MQQLQTEHGIFTSNEETGQTAQEVYDEWIANRNKPQELTTEQRLAQLETLTVNNMSNQIENQILKGVI